MLFNALIIELYFILFQHQIHCCPDGLIPDSFAIALKMILPGKDVLVISISDEYRSHRISEVIPARSSQSGD